MKIATANPDTTSKYPVKIASAVTTISKEAVKIAEMNVKITAAVKTITSEDAVKITTAVPNVMSNNAVKSTTAVSNVTSKDAVKSTSAVSNVTSEDAVKSTTDVPNLLTMSSIYLIGEELFVSVYVSHFILYCILTSL